MIDNRIRFAIGYAMSQLRFHLGALDALADAMERDGSIADCVIAIESCPNVSGQSDAFGADYVQLRRERIRSEGVGLIEKLALGGKNADIEEDRLVTGIGGGYRKQDRFAITGVDPFYAALGVSVLFLIWASSGGLQLH